MLTTVFNGFNCKNELAEEENISIHSRDNERVGGIVVSIAAFQETMNKIGNLNF